MTPLKAIRVGVGLQKLIMISSILVSREVKCYPVGQTVPEDCFRASNFNTHGSIC